MKRIHILKVLPALCAFLFVGCGPSQQEFDKTASRARELEKEVKALRAELEDVKFGASRLLAQAKSAIDANKDNDAKKFLAELQKRHPQSTENQEASALLAQIDARIEAARAERKRQEELKAQETRLALERATRNMKLSTDDIEGITWVSHKNTPVLAKYVALYFGSKDGSAAKFPLRLKFHYYGEDWLFVRSVVVKADDKVYDLGPLKFERDHSSGSIWEWSDDAVENHAMIEHWLKAKHLVVRFNGDKYRSDFTVPSSQQTQLREVYAAWKGMGGVP